MREPAATVTVNRAGEADAFAARLAEELPRLVRLATRLLSDADQAEDCAQETIVGAWRRRDQLRDPSALPAWLRRSLVNRIIDRARSHHRELDLDAVEADWQDDAYSVEPVRVLERAEDDARRQASLAQPMRCWQARRHVSAYLDGELDATTKSKVERHLESCPTCPPLYASLVGIRATMSGLRDPDTVVEEAIAGRIRERLASERVPGFAQAPVSFGARSTPRARGAA